MKKQNTAPVYNATKQNIDTVTRGLGEMEAFQFRQMDVDGDCVIGISDARKLLKIIADKYRLLSLTRYCTMSWY